MKKRRLDLLPEVLPAPNKPGRESPRERALRALNRLATAAAAAATLGAVKGCNSSGYAVVDPMPAPTRCEGVASTIQATATAKSANVFTLKLAKPTAQASSYLPQTPEIHNGKLLSSQVVDEALELEIEANADQSYISFSLPVNCPNGPAHVTVQVVVTRVGDASVDASDATPNLAVSVTDAN